MLEHVRQNSTHGEVFSLDWGVNSDHERYGIALAVATFDMQDCRLARMWKSIELKIESLCAIEFERACANALGELAWQDAHADQIGSMDSLEAACNHRTHAEQTRALGGPVARTACTVVLSGDHDQRHPLHTVALSSVVDAHVLAVRLVAREAALDARNHEVPDAHIGKRPADHDFVIAAPRAVAVEVLDWDIMVAQVNAGR